MQASNYMTVSGIVVNVSRIIITSKARKGCTILLGSLVHVVVDSQSHDTLVHGFVKVRERHRRSVATLRVPWRGRSAQRAKFDRRISHQRQYPPNYVSSCRHATRYSNHPFLFYGRLAQSVKTAGG